jgi:hypothetical protein
MYVRFDTKSLTTVPDASHSTLFCHISFERLLPSFGSPMTRNEHILQSPPCSEDALKSLDQDCSILIIQGPKSQTDLAYFRQTNIQKLNIHLEHRARNPQSTYLSPVPRPYVDLGVEVGLELAKTK